MLFVLASFASPQLAARSFDSNGMVLQRTDYDPFSLVRFVANFVSSLIRNFSLDCRGLLRKFGKFSNPDANEETITQEESLLLRFGTCKLNAQELSS